MEKLIGELYSWNNFFNTVQLRSNEKRKATREVRKTVDKLMSELLDKRDKDIEEFTKYSMTILCLVERIILERLDSKF
jgi:hypothetical protein